MKHSTFLIGILIIFLSFAAFSGLYMSMAQDYNEVIPGAFENVYSNTTVLGEYIQDTTGLGLNMTSESKTAKQLEGEFDDLTTSQLKSIKLVWGAFDVVKNLTITVGNLLHIPPIITAVIMGAIVFALLFAFISLIFRWQS